METPPIAERVLALVRSIAGPLRTPADCGVDTPLAAGGFWLDSLSLLEVIVACEQEFGVEFEAETDLRAEHLQSARTLAEVLRTRGSA
jgi:acyl carrier protein